MFEKKEKLSTRLYINPEPFAAWLNKDEITVPLQRLREFDFVVS